MYNYKQDVCLLHYSLLSTANTLQFSGKFIDADDYKDAINTVSLTVKKILYLAVDGIKDEKQIIKNQLYINDRLHAAVLFNTLRSYNVKSTDAAKHYSSVSFGWPAMDFKFYVELNYNNKWSEYFIKCALQLPSQALYTILKEILSIQFQKHIKFYSWHLVLEAVIQKLCDINLVPDNECSFVFDFTNSEGFIKNTDDTFSLFKELYDVLYNLLSEELNQSNDIELIKTVLHAAKTLMKYSKESKCVECNNFFKLLNDCLKIDSNIEILKAAIRDCSDSFTSFFYSTASWNISECYLILILNCYCLNKINKSEKNYLSSDSNPDWNKNILKYFSESHQKLKEVFMEYFNVSNEKHLELLLKIIQHDFEGASFAMEVLLSNPTVLGKEEYVKILEESSRHIDIINMYPLLLKSVVVNNKSQEIKTRLLKLFYKVLSGSPQKNYNEILHHILEVYGLTEEFQPFDYENRLLLAVQETLTLKEAEEVLPPFFLQSPTATLKYVIEQFFIQGSKAKSLIQTLELIPLACTYSETNEDMTSLIEILKYYFEKTLEPYELERMTILVEILMEVQSKKSILSVNSFLEKCIFPHIDCDDKIMLILACLNKALKILISNGVFDVAVNTLKTLISSLAHSIHNFIENGSGEMKELAIRAMIILEDFQKQSKPLNGVQKIQMGQIIFPLNEAVQVYTAEFLPIDPVFLCQSSDWIWCCKTKDFESFEDKIYGKTFTYPAVINILSQILPHFTKDEWGNCITLIEICCKDSTLKEQILQSSNCPFTLSDYEANLYAVISCFVPSLHFILSEDNVEQPVYMSSCFSNCLMKLLSEDESLKSQMLFAIFADMCHLINRISGCVLDEITSIFSSVLLDLSSLVLSSCADNVQLKSSYQNLMCSAVKCIHNSSQNSTLLQIVNYK